MILFQLPGAETNGLELGLVLSVWRGVKKPRQCSNPVHINGCVAFRAVSLSMQDQSDAMRWFCTATSVAWVARLESLICILDVDSCVSSVH